MKVVKIFENEGDNKEVIYLLENDQKIIQRSNATISKFNLSKWDEMKLYSLRFSGSCPGIKVQKKRRV